MLRTFVSEDETLSTIVMLSNLIVCAALLGHFVGSISLQVYTLILSVSQKHLYLAIFLNGNMLMVMRALRILDNLNHERALVVVFVHISSILTYPKECMFCATFEASSFA